MATFKSKCFRILERAFPEDSKTDLEHKFKIMRDYVNDKRRTLAIDGLEIQDKNFIAQVKRQTRRNQLIRARDKLREVELTKRAVDQALSNKKNPFEGLFGFLVGSQDAVKGARYSVSAHQSAVNKQLHDGFNLDLHEAAKGGKLHKIFLDPSRSEEIFDTVYNLMLNKTFKVKPDPDIVKIAEIIIKWDTHISKKINSVGGFVQRTPSQVMGLHFDPSKIRRISEQDFYNDMFGPEGALDVDKTLERLGFVSFSPRDREQFLLKINRELYDNFKAGRHVVSLTDDNVEGLNTIRPMFVPEASVARKVSKMEFLSFKGGHTHYQVMQKYGNFDRNMGTLILGNYDKLSRAYSLLTHMGTNPKSFLIRVTKELQAKLANQNPRDLDKMAVGFLGITRKSAEETMDKLGAANASGLHPLLQWAVDELAGVNRIPENATVASVGQTLRAAQSIAKLGNATIRSITDFATMASAATFRNGNSFFPEMARQTGVGIKQLFTRLKEADPSGAITEQRIAASYGFLTKSLMAKSITRFSTEDTYNGFLNKMLMGYFKLNGLTWWTDSLKASFALTMARDFGYVSSRTFDQLDPSTRTVMELYGLSSNDWNFVRKMKVTSEQGDDIIIPELIEGASDDVTKSFYPGDNRTPDEIRRQVHDKWSTMFVDQNDHAVLMPGPRERRLVAGGFAADIPSRPGTITREIFSTATHLLTFPVTFITKPMVRDVKHGKYMQLAKLMASMVALGAVGQTAVDIARNRTPRTNFDPNTEAGMNNILDIMVVSGFAGVATDFILGPLHSNKSMAESVGKLVSGPVFGQGIDMFDILKGAAQGDNKSAQAINLVQTNLPLANLFYTKKAMDFLIWDRLQEWANPGYKSRMKRKLRKRTGQKPILSGV